MSSPVRLPPARWVTHTAAFRRWFGHSKVVDADGKPLVVYHVTRHEFAEFDIKRGDLGAHFGTAEQAREIARYFGVKGQTGARTIPAYLSLRNPLRLDDMGAWSGPAFALQLQKLGLLPADLPVSNWSGAEGREAVRQAIMRGGYDGVVYANTREGRGDSYIAFRAEQIKSAIGNRGTFDLDDPNVLFDRDDRPLETVDPAREFARRPRRRAAGLDEFGLRLFGLRSIDDVLPAYRNLALRPVPAFLRDVDAARALRRELATIDPIASLDDNGNISVGSIDRVEGLTRFADERGLGLLIRRRLAGASILAPNPFLEGMGFVRYGPSVTFAASGGKAQGQQNQVVWSRNLQGAMLYDLTPGSPLPRGMYSALQAAVMGLDAKSMTPGDWQVRLKAMVGKNDVKADEIEWSGVLEWLGLQQGKVTKEQVQSYLSANGVQVKELLLGNRSAADSGFYVEKSPDDDGVWLVYNGQDEVVEPFQVERDAENFVRDRKSDEAGGTRYSQYTLPGGENYREVLLTLPRKETTTGDVAQRLFGRPMASLLEDERQAVADEMRRTYDATARDFRSGHWDQPNVLAHIRMNDRTDADGKKVLFVEEIQSDWGQRRRKNLKMAEESGSQMLRDGVDKQTPPAPFIGSTGKWLTLALKRVLRMAAEGAYDRVAFVTGEQSAELYRLSSAVGKVVVTPRSDTSRTVRLEILSDSSVLTLGVRMEDGIIAGVEGGPGNLGDLRGKPLADVVGRNIGAKILKGPERQVISSEGLSIGSYGLRTFYDDIVPKALADLAKRMGGNVGAAEFGGLRFGVVEALKRPAPDRFRVDGVDEDGARVGYAAAPTRERAQAIADRENALIANKQLGRQPAIDITPEMRERILGGLPLFDRTLSNDNLIPVPQGILPDLIETAPQLAAAFRRWGAGKITDEALAGAVRADLDKRKNRREQTGDRVRGADWLRKRLTRACRTGELSTSQVDLALWLIDKNPAIAADLGISIREGDERSSNGTYNVLTRVVTVFSSQANADTATHEILHHTERMLPADVKAGIRKEWLKQLRVAVKRARLRATEQQHTMLGWMLEAAEQGDDRLALSLWSMKVEGQRPLSDLIDYKLAAASEFWAANGAALMRQRAESEQGWIATARRWYKELIAKVRELLGLPSEAAVLRGIRAVLAGDGSFVSKSMISGAGSDTVRQDRAEQTDTPAFRRWFGDSKVVNAEGRPLVVYHATPLDFTRFARTKDAHLGYHFGTAVQANKRTAARELAGKAEWRLIPVHLSMKNPLRVIDHGDWSNPYSTWAEVNRALGGRLDHPPLAAQTRSFRAGIAVSEPTARAAPRCIA